MVKLGFVGLIDAREKAFSLVEKVSGLPDG